MLYVKVPDDPKGMPEVVDTKHPASASLCDSCRRLRELECKGAADKAVTEAFFTVTFVTLGMATAAHFFDEPFLHEPMFVVLFISVVSLVCLAMNGRFNP